MFKKYVIGVIAVLGISGNATAWEPSDYVLPVCNLETSDYVYWDALGENVVLHTKMSTEEGGLPSARLTLEMADGEKVDLGGGGKYFDDFAPDDVPSCAEHMAAAKNLTLSSLDPQFKSPEVIGFQLTATYRSMSEIQADVRNAGQCDMDAEDHQERYACEAHKYLVEKIQENERQVPKTEFDRFVSINAPVLEITYSTYGNETFAFDPKTRKLVALFYDGC